MKVFIIAAVSLDGFIARHDTQLADWTGKADKVFFNERTKQAGTIVMGSTTYKTIGRALPERRTIVYTHNPDNITDAGIETTTEDPSILLEKLKREGTTEVAICGGSKIYDLFMKNKLVDELFITVVPTIFGQGITLFSSSLKQTVELLDTKLLDNNTILLHYRII